VKRTLKTAFSLCVFFLLFLISPLLAAPEDVVEITVREGDYVIKICEEYLEDPRQWREIARINELRNPDLIYPGQTLIIPVAFLRGVREQGEVAFVQGDVTMQAPASNEWLPVGLRALIGEGTKIRTGDMSAVEIVFGSGASFLQKSDSVSEIVRIRKKGDFREERLNIVKGRTLTKIRKATGREPRFEIETPSAVCAARGTLFRTSVDDVGCTRSEVLEGQAHVEAMRQREVVSEGEGTLVRKGEPPLRPRKLLPPPGVGIGEGLFSTLPLSVDLLPVEGAVGYRLSVSKDSEGKETVFEGRAAAAGPVEVRYLDDGRYFVHAVGVDEIGLEGMPSVPAEIRVRVNPSPPGILLPMKDASCPGKSVEAEWREARGAVAYRVQVAADEAFYRMVEEVARIEGRTFTTRELEPGRYYLRIRSIADDGYEGAWSDAVAFTVNPPPEPVGKGYFSVFLGIAATFGLIFVLLP